MPSEKRQTQHIKKERTDFREPQRYNAILHNDCFTTMDLVVRILMTIFRKTEPEATTIMLHVHNNGEGIAGTYTYDICATKIKQATDMARAEGYPLRLSMRPV